MVSINNQQRYKLFTMKKLHLLIIAFLLGGAFNIYAQNPLSLQPNRIWSIEKANEWYQNQKWLTGTNYIPANAINQLEMWQAETFNIERIDEELSWAEDLGFTTMRVFLHSLAYKQDPKGFKERINKFLAVADKHKIKTMLVFFDDCWNKNAKIGKQPDPQPGVHNSGWLQDPGDADSNDRKVITDLEIYLKDILKTFAKDKRILLWDLYNEPGNTNNGDTSLPLLTKAFEWARAINPEQPITAGLWSWNLENINKLIVANSDIITYHNYGGTNDHLKVLQILKSFGRPMICTEYMARSHGSKFENILPMLKKENVGAINWGFVAGKTNTIYSWENKIPDGSQPKEWFHDILNPDGSAYRKQEVELIKRLNKVLPKN